jgi:cytochrome c-type biogenesis protein CcmH
MIAMGSIVLALWLAAWQAPGVVAQPQPQPVVVAPLPPAVEQEARQIERMLIAPCCWMQPVSEHQSQASEDVKLQIRAWLQAGRTRQQVLDAFVEHYGVRILAEPPNTGFSRFLYLTPVIVFGVSGVGLFVLVRRMTAARKVAATANRSAPLDAGGPDAQPVPTSSTDEERLDEELREMD